MEKFFTFIFGLSGWALMACALKTRKPCFQTTYSHQSLLFQLWPHGLILVCWARPQSNSRIILAEMLLLPQKVVWSKLYQPYRWLQPWNIPNYAHPSYALYTQQYFHSLQYNWRYPSVSCTINITYFCPSAPGISIHRCTAVCNGKLRVQ